MRSKFWETAKMYLLNTIEIADKRAVRHVEPDRYMEHTPPMFKYLHIVKLNDPA